MIKFALIIFCLIFGTSHSFAEEKPAAEKAEGGAKEEGKEKKSAEKPWVALTTKVAELGSKRRSLEHELDELFEQKKRANPSGAEMRSLVKESEETYKKLVEAKEEESKQIRILQFRYPERAALAKVSAEKIETPTLLEMEKEKTARDGIEEDYDLMKHQYPNKSKAD